MQRDNLPLGYLYCPYCDEKFEKIPSSKRCNACNSIKSRFFCNSCRFNGTLCERCDIVSQPEEKKLKSEDARNAGTGISFFGNYITLNKFIPFVIVVIVVLIRFVFSFYNSSTNDQHGNEKLLKNLREEFPSQRNETWYHVLSVLDKRIPSVKTITFLHGEDKRTPDCLTSKMVLLSSGNENIKSDEITFSAVGHEGKDYGFALEHYRSIVEKFRVFITDLTTVPGNIARIFHSLCDEVSSDIKPSLFIFTLKYDKSTAGLKPIDRAGQILRKIWSDLPHNEIFPLLSRVAKNVVEILPEERISC